MSTPLQRLHLLHHLHPRGLAAALRIGLRQLAADPGYSAIVLLGLALALAVNVLIIASAQAWLFTDRDVPEPGRVVSFEFRSNMPGQRDDWLGQVPFVLHSALKTAQAPLAAVARCSHEPRFSVRSGDRVLALNLLQADPEIVQVFGLQPLAGDLAATLARRDGIALTPAVAERLFGTREVLGRTLRAGGHTLTVGALLPERTRDTSVLSFEAIVGIESPVVTLLPSMFTRWFDFNGEVYARLAPGARPEALGRLAQSLFDASPALRDLPPAWTAGGRQVGLFRATPLDRLPLHGAGSEGRRLRLGVLGGAAGLMLALAAVNYVNLTSVRVLRRQREIGIRKSLGASPRRLAVQFVGESVLVALLAAALGLLLAWLLAPVASPVLQPPLPADWLTPASAAFTLGAAVLLGVLTGAYPAWVALRVNAAESLAGRSHGENASGRWLRRALTAAQFGAAVGLSAVAVVVLWQVRHAGRLPLGFSPEGLVAVDLPRNSDPALGRQLREALLRQDGVQAAAAGSDVFGRGWSSSLSTMESPRGTLTLRVFTVQPALFGAYGIPVIAGRLDDAMDSRVDNTLVLDRRGAAALGFADPRQAIGQVVDRDEGRTVVAVVENLRVESARERVMPKGFMLRPAVQEALVVRGRDVASARQAIERLWPQHYPDELPRVQTVAHYLARQVEDDRRLGWLIAGAGVMALGLACFGLYALAAYTVRLRTREIVLRKLHGASAGAVLALLAREFGTLLALGAALALPLAWVASQQFLGRFVDQAPVGPWPFVLAPAVALAITALATLRHAAAALALRPALALRG